MDLFYDTIQSHLLIDASTWQQSQDSQYTTTTYAQSSFPGPTKTDIYPYYEWGLCHWQWLVKNTNHAETMMNFQKISMMGLVLQGRKSQIFENLVKELANYMRSPLQKMLIKVENKS